MCHEKTDLKIFDSVREPRAHVVTITNYWDSLFWDIGYMSMILIRFSYEDPSGHELSAPSLCCCHAKRRMCAAMRAHPSFGMTTPKTLRSVFS